MERQVYGWMNEDERMALRRWAFGAKALEVGCYEGLSTSQIAATANHVTVIDTFDGRATGRERDTETAFHENMRTCGVQNRIFAIKGESQKVLPCLEEKAFGFVFIDGDHSYEAVSEDARIARSLLAEGGALAFHDFDQGHPGVVRTVENLLADGMYFADQQDSLVALREGPKPERKKPRVALLYPSYDGWFMHAGVVPSKLYWHEIVKNGTSIITTTFNEMLCQVYNSETQFDYLAMLHADVVPDMYWLDTLVEELEVNRLDILSAVVPIKNDRGTTSTGLEVVGTQWAVRRLTLNEIYGWNLSPTFTAKDIPGRSDQGLLLNTGCWVMRWNQPWSRGWYFRQQDRIVWSTSAQKYGKESASEDWDWSRQMISRGCRLGATTKVGLHHQFPQCHNRSAWGTWQNDEDFFREEAVIAAATEKEVACA